MPKNVFFWPFIENFPAAQKLWSNYGLYRGLGELRNQFSRPKKKVHKVFENPTAPPPPLEKILDPPLFISVNYSELTNHHPLLKSMKNCKAEIIHSFSQRKYKTTLNSIASFSTLTSQEDQYKIDLLRLRNTRVRLGSESDNETARLYPAAVLYQKLLYEKATWT